jgi:Ca2+-binding RTX toxin-like protein
MWKPKLRGVHTSRPDRQRPSRRVCPGDVTGIGLLDRRVLPTVTASFSAAGEILRVVGDAQDNIITVSRDVGGTIFVNNGAVAIQGDRGASVGNTQTIMIVGGGGNDNLSIDETNGAMPAASLFGGDGNDVLTGGSGDDFVDGGAGNDIVFLGAGDDTFQWNPGDGSDTVSGQSGFDTMVFNGSDAFEKFDISAEGSRVLFTRDVGGVSLELDGVEDVDLNPLGGADSITVNDTSATDLFQLNLSLAGATNSGDGQDDVVTVNGTDGDDDVQIAAFDNGADIVVGGLLPKVSITGAEGTNDVLTVNTQGGNDVIDASSVPANLIGLSLNGGAGNDLILGSLGDDLVKGGPGNDMAEMGDGRDTFVWNPGDGSDTVLGQAGSDRLVFNGSDAAEKFDVSASGSRVLFTRDVGGVAMDLEGVEDVDLNALGGADTVTVNDTSATDLSAVRLDLASAMGGGDGQADAVIVNGTDGADAIRILAASQGTRITVAGLTPLLNITGAEGASDDLTVNALGGNDVVDASNLPTGLIGLTVNLGDGQLAALTTTTLRTSTPAAVFGQTVSLTATVNAPAGTPSGTVSFLDGNALLGIAPIDDAGQAGLMVSLGVGNHALAAVFGGSSDFAASASAVVTESVNPAATAIALNPSVNPIVAGQPATLTATVAAVAPGAGTPTGTVAFMDGDVPVGTAALGVDGTAILATTFVGSGLHTVTAVYGGDRNFAGSSRTVTEQVSAPALAATRTSLFASANPARRRHLVVFRATVRGHDGSGSPTGTVTFMIGNVAVAQMKLDRSGKARWTARFLFRDRFVVTAIYSGDGNFAKSSRSLTERIA